MYRILTISAALAGALALTACNEVPDEKAPDASISATAEELARAREEVRNSIDPVALPDFAAEAPVVGACRDTLCETDRALFKLRDWPRAWLGEYQAQRNVAYCLGTGCNGTVLIDKSSSCAWRTVLMQSHPAEATDLDANQLEIECGGLSEAQRQLAIAKTEDIVRKIRTGG